MTKKQSRNDPRDLGATVWYYIDRKSLAVYTNTVHCGVGSLRLTKANLEKMLRDLKAQGIPRRRER